MLLADSKLAKKPIDFPLQTQGLLSEAFMANKLLAEEGA